LDCRSGFGCGSVYLTNGFFECWQFTALDGIPPASCNVESNVLGTPMLNAQGTPIGPAIPTAEISAPAVQAPTWDGGSRVNIVFFGLRSGSESLATGIARFARIRSSYLPWTLFRKRQGWFPSRAICG